MHQESQVFFVFFTSPLCIMLLGGYNLPYPVEDSVKGINFFYNSMTNLYFVQIEACVLLYDGTVWISIRFTSVHYGNSKL